MKILLLGADGFIGKHVRQALSEEHEVYAATRNPSTDDHEQRVDLEDKQSIVEALKSIQPEAIINCAGVVENSEKSKLNVLFTTNLLEAVKEASLKPKRIIISGSAAEYGVVDMSNIPVSESAPLNANGGYGESKLKEGLTALELAKKYELPVIIARIFNPIGVGMHPRFLIPKMIEQIREFGTGARTIIEVSRLNSKRDYINVKDIATAIKVLVEGEPKETIYNIGSGKSASNGELIELILNNSKLDARPEIVETSAEEEPLVAIQADITRIRTEFNWEPMYTLEQTVKEIIHATQ